jgi:hypothetical protein
VRLLSGSLFVFEDMGMAEITLEKISPRFMFLDPASGKSNTALRNVRARSAIVTVGVDAISRIWVLDAWADRVGTNEIRAKFLDLYEKWLPLVSGYEAVGQQSLLEDPIRDEAKDRGLVVPLVPVIPTTKVDKFWRIRSVLQPVIGAGRLIICDHLLELRSELTSFPMSHTVDLVDALASAVALVPPMQTEQQKQDDAEELAHYLRESGASMHEINDRMREIGAFNHRKRDNMTAWDTLRKKFDRRY